VQQNAPTPASTTKVLIESLMAALANNRPTSNESADGSRNNEAQTNQPTSGDEGTDHCTDWSTDNTAFMSNQQMYQHFAPLVGLAGLARWGTRACSGDDMTHQLVRCDSTDGFATTNQPTTVSAKDQKQQAGRTLTFPTDEGTDQCTD
jgi:hypothetical protein